MKSRKNPDIRKIIGKINMSNDMRKFIKKLTLKREQLVNEKSKQEIESIIENYSSCSDEEKDYVLEVALVYHFPIALTIVKKFASYLDQSYIDDLIQTLLSHITISLQTYDKSKGFRYHTYLSNTLLGIAMKFLDASRMIKFNYYYVKKKYGEDYINYNLRTILESEISEIGEDLDIDSYLYYEHEEFYKEEDFNKDVIYYLMEQCLVNSDFTEQEKEIIYEIFISQKDRSKIKSSAIAKKFGVETSYVYSVKKKFISILMQKLREHLNIFD